MDKERAAKIREMRQNMRERKNAVFMKLGAKIRAYFFTGILVTAPVAITLYMTYKAIGFIDRNVGNIISDIIPEQYLDLIPVTIPGLGVIVLFFGFILVGMFAAGFMGRFFLKLGEWIVYKMPLISTIYSLLKQVFETFLSNKNNSFKQVVLFEYPRKGIWIYGLLSGETKGEVADKLGKPMLNVFVPTTPNPTSGFLIFVPKEDVIYVDIAIEEALKFIISCGVVAPEDNKKLTKKNK